MEANISQTWYFARLAFIASPAGSNTRKLQGTLFLNYHLIRAKDYRSAFKKAEYILSTREHCDGSGKLNGKRINLKKAGILDLEPLYEPLKSGVEIFDESRIGVRYARIKQKVISSRKKLWLIIYEKKHGKPKLIPLLWGKKFDRL
jgi:Domain of unknown function (DUF4288)